MRGRRDGAAAVGRKLAAEFAGTFFVTFAAVAVDVLYFTGDKADYVSRWLARGFVTAALIFALSEISGAHVNPVVSIAFAIRRAMRWGLAAAYCVAQFAGAIAASGAAMALFGAVMRLGASRPADGVAPLTALAFEAIMSFLLVCVILLTADAHAAVGKNAALAVGFTIAACGFFAGALTGASMNPARSLGSQLVSGRFADMWIYAAGPLIGAVAAAYAVLWLLGPADVVDTRKATGKRT